MSECTIPSIPSLIWSLKNPNEPYAPLCIRIFSEQEDPTQELSPDVAYIRVSGKSTTMLLVKEPKELVAYAHRILDISPELAYYGYHLSFMPNYAPTSIYDTELRLKNDEPLFREQFKMAYYLLCHAITMEFFSSNPRTFYNMPNIQKHPYVQKYLKKYPNFFEREDILYIVHRQGDSEYNRFSTGFFFQMFRFFRNAARRIEAEPHQLRSYFLNTPLPSPKGGTRKRKRTRRTAV